MSNSSAQSNSHFTIAIRPVPRGISRDDLVAGYLLKFRQIKNVRFGDGRGVNRDVMYVDYFECKSAISAVAGLNGTKDPGLSRLILSVTLTPATAAAIERLDRITSERSAKRVHLDVNTQTIEPKTAKFQRPPGAFKYLKSKTTGEEICLIDFGAIGF